MVSRTKKMLVGLLASIVGFSVITVGSAIIAYESMFQRVERPNYDFMAGEYCYQRIAERLPRQELYYQANSTKLKGYYYESLQKKGLVVIVHGMNAGADDYLPMIEYMVNAGYNVFAYDCTGTYDSEGKDTVGMCQQLVDLDGTIEYLKQNPVFQEMPLFLIGHSWGGYACASVLSLTAEVKACATISAMHNAPDIIVEKAKEYVGDLSKMPAPAFDIYQRLLFKDYVDCNTVKGINARNIPILVAHGETDKKILFNKQSIIAFKDKIKNPNVQYYIGKDSQGDHCNIWHSKEAAAYQKTVKAQLKQLKKSKGDAFTNEDKRTFYRTVDHALYSEVNQDLMNQIVTMFDNAL